MYDGEPVEKFLSRLNTNVQEFYIKKYYTDRYNIGQIILNKSEGWEKLEKTNKNKAKPVLPYNSDNINLIDKTVVDEIINSFEYKNIPKFSFNGNRVVIWSIKKARIRFTGNISKVLNIPESWLMGRGQLDYISNQNVNDNPTLTQVLYVYTDIIEEQLVGDKHLKLLRTVIVDSDYLKTAWNHYDNPHYVRVRQTEINTINIQINDDNGELIRFKEGKVVAKLHFRPVRYAL
jgi:hypothetical protein